MKIAAAAATAARAQLLPPHSGVASVRASAVARPTCAPTSVAAAVFARHAACDAWWGSLASFRAHDAPCSAYAQQPP